MRQRIATLGARPEFWLFSLLFWITVSACRSLGTPWARVALTEALRWAIGLILALALSRGMPRRESAIQILVALCGGITLACLFGASSSGVVGPYSDHQLCASALLVLLPIVLAVGLTARTPAWRWGAQILTAASLVCLTLTRTRSAWVGALVLGLVFAALWTYRSGWRPRQKRMLLLPILAVFSTLGAFWVATGSTDLGVPLAARAATFQSLNQDGSWRIRLAIWRGAARMVSAQPLFGCGVGRYPGSQWQWTQAGSPLQPNERPSLSEQAHDFYVQTAAELGVVGLGLYGAALMALALQGAQRLREYRGRALGQRDIFLIAVLSMLAGQGMDAVASPSWQFAEVSLLFWAVLGIGLAALRPEWERQPAFCARPLPQMARFSAVGLAAVFLAAQILPLGLLSPVEAYTHSGAVSFSTLAISQYTTNCPSGYLCFSLLAHFSDGADQNVTLDNDPNVIPSSFGCLQSNTSHTCNSTFASGSNRNQLKVAASERGIPLQIMGSFTDYSQGKGTRTRYSSSLVLTP